MSPSAHPIWGRLRRVALSLPVLIVVGSFALYVALGYLAAGPLIAHLIPRLAQSQLDSRATVGKVAFDPLRLDLTVDHLRLTTPQGVPLAGFDRLFVDFAPASLWRWAWTFREIRIDRPQVNVAIARGGAMNWDALVRAIRRGAKPSKPADTIPRVVVERLRIADGALRYADADRDHPYTTVLTPLNLQVHDLSTLPKARGQYALSLLLPQQNAALRWKGYIGINPLVSGGELELSGLDLTAAAQAVPGLAKTVRIAGGTAALRAAYSAVLGNTGLQWAVDHLAAQVQALRANAAGVDWRWQTLQLDSGRIDGAARTASLQRLTLDGLRATSGTNALALRAARLQGAQLDWGRRRAEFGPLALQHIDARIGQAQVRATRVQTRPGTVDLAKQTVRLPQLALLGVRVQPQPGETAAWLDLPTLEADALQADLAQHRVQLGALQLDAATVRLTRLPDGRIDLLQAVRARASGSAQSAAPPAVAAPAPATGWDVAVARIATRVRALDYTDRSLRSPFHVRLADATLDAVMHAALGAGGPVRLQASDLRLVLGAMQAQSDNQTLARWSSARLGPTRIDLSGTGAPRIVAGALEVDGLHARVELQSDGLNWVRALTPAAAAAAANAAPRGAASPEVDLASLTLRNLSATLIDRTAPAPIRLDLVQGQASAQNLSLDLRKPVAVQLRFALAQGGQFSASGQIAPQPLAGELSVQVRQLALPPFGSLLAPYVRLLLTSGTASADGEVQLRVGRGAAPQVRYQGAAQVDDLALVEPDGRTPFLGWRKLAASGMTVDTAPLSVEITELQAVQPYGRIVLNPDRTLNVQAILLTRKPATLPPEPARAPLGAARPLPFALRIDRTAIEDADVDFTDQSIKPNFRVRMQKLSGVINGLSDAAHSSAQIALDGQVNAYGEAKVRGRLQPFHATDATDVTLDLRNLDMAAISPYAGKFAGRTIESGRLDARLEYKIEKAQMQGNNQFTITRLKLGPRVDSPDAIDLPLDLAIAVLENRDGVIDLDLPVHGDLNNPQFSYGSVIRQAIVNVLTKVVTAPFRALAALFGGAGGEQTTQDVHFAPGSAAVSPPEREKLSRIAQALGQRPRLVLQVTPTYDPALDTAALQRDAVRREVLARLGVSVPPDADPGPLDLDSARTRNAIEALYLDRHPSSALDALKKTLPQQSAERHPLQRAMLERLEKAVVVPQSALDALAQARARAVVAALTTGEHALPAARVRTAPAAKPENAAQADVVLALGLQVTPEAQSPAAAPAAVQ
jgi:outer membrane protein OmpA-like peptidoglycan-associated protein